MTAPLRIDVVILPHGEGLPLPFYATEGAAAMDLYAAIESTVVIVPHDRVLIPTGLRVALPPNHEWQLRSRSGLTLKEGVVVANSPGTIDEDYRGEVGIVLLNTTRAAYTVRRGDRVAQAVLAPVVRGKFNVVSVLPDTLRGQGGFGSSGR